MVKNITDSIFAAYSRKNVRRLIKLNENPLKTQQLLYKKFKSNFVGTKIYTDLGFNSINSYEEFVQQIEPKKISFYEPYIEDIINGQENVLFKDKLKYVCLSSGTSGKEKFIPYNEGIINVYKKSQLNIGTIAKFLYPEIKPFHRMQLFYSNFVSDSEKINGLPKIYISGLLSSITPKIFQRNFIPELEILKKENFEEKVDFIAEIAKNHDVGAASSIPIFIVKILEGLISRLNINTINEIWPNLDLIIYSGTSIEKYKDTFKTLIGKDVNFFGAYYSSEAPIGWIFDKEQNYIFNLDLILFSFIEVDSESKQITIDRLETGKKYEIVISCPNGLIQYRIGDIIEIVSVDPILKFKISGRESVLVNIGAEKYSQSSMEKAICLTEKDISMDITHYFLYPYRIGNNSGYAFGLVIKDNNLVDKGELTEIIDKNLKICNPPYELFRKENRTINPPKIHFVDESVYNRYFEKYNAKGQLKMKSVFDSMEDYFEFLATITDTDSIDNIKRQIENE